MPKISVTTEWLTEQTEMYFKRIQKLEEQIEELQKENRSLNKMRRDIEVALASLHEEDEHGNVKAYKYDDAISKIRQAVYPDNTDREWKYSFPFDPEVKRGLDNLRIFK